MTRPNPRRPLPPRLLPQLPKTRLGPLFGAWLAFCALLGLGMLGVVIWAIIKLVAWVITK